jgi:hypothetical protein
MTDLVGQLGVNVIDVAAWAVWVMAIVGVARTPARRFVSGWRTKAGRLAMACCFYVILGGIFVPFGAAFVLVGLRGLKHQPQPLDLAEPRGPQLPD